MLLKPLDRQCSSNHNYMRTSHAICSIVTVHQIITKVKRCKLCHWQYGQHGQEHTTLVWLYHVQHTPCNMMTEIVFTCLLISLCKFKQTKMGTSSTNHYITMLHCLLNSWSIITAYSYAIKLIKQWMCTIPYVP